MITYKSIKKGKHKDVSNLIDMVNSSFGTDYILEEDIEDAKKNKNTDMILAYEKDNIVGMISYHIINEDRYEEFDIYNRLFKKHDVNPKYQAYYNQTLVIDTLYVSPQKRKNGLGSCMTQKVIKEAKKQKLENIITIAWLNNTNDTSKGLFNRLGFKEICVEEDFWKEDSIEKDYECPICGNPCRCAADFFVLDL